MHTEGDTREETVVPGLGSWGWGRFGCWKCSGIGALVPETTKSHRGLQWGSGHVLWELCGPASASEAGGPKKGPRLLLGPVQGACHCRLFSSLLWGWRDAEAFPEPPTFWEPGHGEPRASGLSPQTSPGPWF